MIIPFSYTLRLDVRFLRYKGKYFCSCSEYRVSGSSDISEEEAYKDFISKVEEKRWLDSGFNLKIEIFRKEAAPIIIETNGNTY